jgi:glycosyltransferase involved in cell wall biosynthesis
MTRHWSINGRFLTQPVTGVQRYAHEIVRALDQLVSEGHPGTHGLELELLVPPDARSALPLKAIPARAVGRQRGQIWEQTSLPVAARGRGLINLCNTAPLTHGKEIVCIHDLNTRLAPQSYRRAFRLYYRLMMPAIGRRARAIATVSSFSAEQIAGFGIAPASKITVIPNGHEHAMRWRARHTPQTEAAASPNTIVLLGSPAPHKNARLILDLAPALQQTGFKIAVAGVSDPTVFAADGSRIEADNIAWLGRVDDCALAALLRDSLCLAFPSLTEGFGLPPLEAMAIGCPVVATGCASLPEVCGDAALYASPHDPADWLRAFQRIRSEEGLRQRLQAAGRRQAATFSWRRSAELYLQMLARLDNVAWSVSATPSLPAAAE